MRAIVVGGGIGGLAAAIGLRRAGWDAEVFERADAVGDVGAGIALWANAVRALDELGLAGILAPLSLPSEQGGIYAPDGRPLAAMSAAEARQAFGAHGVALHRAELVGALLAALGPGRVRLGARCVGFAQDGRGVTARFADGTEARGDILVGADGLRSAVRAQIHGDAPPSYAGYTAWRGVAAMDHRRARPGEIWGAGRRFGQIPIAGGRVYWFATHSEPAGGRSPGGEREAVLRLFRGWPDPVEALVEATDPAAVLRHDIYDRPPLSRWGEGRVTLLGDAAHPMTPNLGQGGCQALEDAAVLARSLRGADDPAAALRAYEAARIPRTSQIVRQSRQIGAVAQWSSPAAVWLRAAVLRAIPDSQRQRQVAAITEAAF